MPAQLVRNKRSDTSAAPLQCPSGSTFAKAIDRRHQGRQVALVNPALSQPCGEDIEQFDPSVDVARFDRRHGNLDALLDDSRTLGPRGWPAKPCSGTSLSTISERGRAMGPAHSSGTSSTPQIALDVDGMRRSL